MATDWHVEYQDTRPDIMSNGRMARVVDVHFVIDTDPAMGHQDTVTVPETQYTPDNVATLINYKVAAIKAVAQL